LPNRGFQGTFCLVTADLKNETFAQRLERLEQAREKARLARQALDKSAGKKLPRRKRGGRHVVLRGGKMQRGAADPSAYLDSPEAVAAYLSNALAIEDAGFVAGALGFVARARGMSDIARSAGLSRESLYRALKSTGNPEFETILRVCRALGLRLVAEPAE
jgi:probable addiction module antidote protein